MVVYEFRKEVVYDGTVRYRPIIPITLTNGKTSLGVSALLDTGADITVISESLARSLGLDLTEEKETLKGFKEETKVYSSLAGIGIEGDKSIYTVILPILVIPEEEGYFETEEAVIGLRGFFDKFDICFMLHSDKIELKPA